MRLGVLITSISNFGQKGFYNSQEIGLAKALAKQTDSVVVFKLVELDEEKRCEKIAKNAVINFIPAKSQGINGIIDTVEFESDIDALIHFSDTQFSVPTVFKWCKKNHITYLPYIGVVESHSTNKIKQLLTNLLFKRNLSVYKKCTCCVKTPYVQEQLNLLGINNSVVTPVGLDIDLLNKDYFSADISNLKEKYGYKADDKILLFIGRFVDEKQPLKMIDVFSQAYNKDKEFKLLMVGKGELKEKVCSRIKELNIEKEVQMIDKIPNNDIWELYRIADSFINLNQQEIFGMAILEAMYYGCKVVALKAPGPNYIIEKGINGCLAENDRELIDFIIKKYDFNILAHERIENNFIWDNSAEKFINVLKK